MTTERLLKDVRHKLKDALPKRTPRTAEVRPLRA
jgi:hypothetical protein